MDETQNQLPQSEGTSITGISTNNSMNLPAAFETVKSSTDKLLPKLQTSDIDKLMYLLTAALGAVKSSTDKSPPKPNLVITSDIDKLASADHDGEPDSKQCLRHDSQQSTLMCSDYPAHLTNDYHQLKVSDITHLVGACEWSLGTNS